jgi:single-stranded-DNA-specific exonuclease
MQSKWMMKNIRADYGALSRELKLPEEIARCLVNRCPGTLEEMKAYLHPRLSDLHDPGLLKDMDLAVDLILSAMEEEKKIRLVGDFDIDGAMSIYIALSALREVDALVDYEIPDRVKDGYGINKDIVEKAKADGIDLIITFDNGIAAFEAVQHAKDLGMMIIVTDHHDIPYLQEGEVKRQTLPPADAVVNPKQEGCPYPYKGLCGAVVAFKLVTRLYEIMGLEEDVIKRYLPYAAIATVGDIMDLTGENRIIVKHGLALLKTIQNEGLRALVEAANLDLSEISTYSIGFVLGPCFNAAGRLSTAKKTVDLLFAEGEEAKKLALELYSLNQKRKAMTEEGVLLAEEEIRNHGYYEDSVMVLHLPEVHESLAGIIAGRVKERYYRPAIVLTTTEHGLKGSARSIEEYNIFEGLSGVKGYLKKFGGHPMAAGLTIEEENLKELRQGLNENAELSEEDLLPKVRIDARLSPGKISESFVRALDVLEPFGKENPKPVFAEKGLSIAQMYYLGQNKDHLKFLFRSEDSLVEGIYFYGVKKLEDYFKDVHGIEPESLEHLMKDKKVDILFYPDLNTYNGITRVQIKILDLRIS